MEMKNKNPWIAAILNLLLPGIGFIYLEEGPFVPIGTVLLIVEILESAIAWSALLTPLTLTFSLISACIWAALGYVCAEYVNKCALQPPPSPPLPAVSAEPAQAPAPPPPAPIPKPRGRRARVSEEGERKFFCRYCGAENKSDAVFCERCGKKL